jgi:catechol 2,3-dioxygenase-like lactoylglutathione lyase family enzyme
VLLGIDHVVIACQDPDATAALLEDRLGLAASEGGRHEEHGTMNRLVWLGDAYLELVGIVDLALASVSWFGGPLAAALGGNGDGGFVTWAIAVNDLDETLRWAPPDIGLVGPFDGERHRPDERVVRWRVARPDVISALAPFLIEHDPRAAEWTPADRSARADARHPLGGRVRLSGVELLTASPAVAAARLRALLAASVEPVGRGAVRVRLGPHEVRFVTARPGSAAAVVDVVADVPLRTRVARVGDCEIRLRGQPAVAVARPQPDVDATV